jgi:curved DNA-binding protein
MDYKDYYDILGILPDADKKAIQQAFRKLARQYHPDVNPGDKDAEDKFKTINEAHQVLSDAEQRKKYDALRTQYQEWQQAGGRQQDFDWQNWSGQSGKGTHVRYASPEDLEDLFGSDSAYSDFFNSIFGQAYTSGRGSNKNTAPRARRGRNVEYEVDLDLKEAFHGADRLLEMDGHRIRAAIPPGVRTGSRVRLSGQGEPGKNGGTDGDLYLVINVLPNDSFERQGGDLHIDMPVDIFTAIAGGETRVPTLERPLTLKIPSRTNAGRSFRLRGMGMPHLGDPNKHGDLYAMVRLVLPDALTDQEVNSIRELSSSRLNHFEQHLDEASKK